ncbi:MAG: response regulator [Candidatus Aminicenantes bacterium]|nr:response regulator [Candidatus Aminicenantes bacterium]
MSDVSKKQEVYRNEFQFLDRAKEISENSTLSKAELSREYAKILGEYETLLKRSIRETRTGRADLGEPDIPPDVPEEIAAMKNRLLAHITHEFLTPLNLIITPLEQMMAKSRSREEKKTLSLMHRNGQRLLLIISQILELLKLESRKLKLSALRQNLVPFLRGITASFEFLAEQQEVNLVFRADNENIPLYFEPDKIADVVCNIIMNSLKFTPPGGWIKLSVRDLSEDSVEISLHNTGPDISMDQTTRIFDRFYQLNKRFEHYIKGLGIGLFLAKEYIKLHHGAIRVNSGAGKGTEFVITLPKGKEHLKPGEIDESTVSSGEDKAGGRISKRYAFMVQLEREENRDTPPDSSGLTGIERDNQDRDIVLVVEDSKDMRGFIKNLLEGDGFLVGEAVNGRQGIDIAKEIIPDVIISDIVMPEVNGYQLCEVLKKEIKTSHIPIILLSVNFTEEEIIRGLEAGADDYIIKPFSMEILLSRVKNLVKQRRLLQQRVQLETVTHPDELALSSLDNLLLKKIQQIIEKNLSDTEFGLDELADALHISRASLHRKVTALTGQAPNKFIQSYRLKRSVDLLKSNYGNVTEVAFMVGFSSSAYFTKCFKEKFKRLPSDFRIL